MRCPSCGAENLEGLKFCNECAAPFKRRCPSCGFENTPTAKFCGECAAPLNAPPSRLDPANASSPPAVRIAAQVVDSQTTVEGERKTVTALFADIKGSMELMEDLDPEEARAIVDPALKLMIDAAHRYDGYIVQSTGDGIFALFGAPVAHEDHPQRALYAALRMQEEMRRYGDRMRTQGQTPIQVRIGVNTGEVVVRSIQTGADHTEYTPIGHSTSLAARLQGLATPGSTIVSGHTRGFVEGYFQLKALGQTKIKGVTEPVEVFEVIGVGPLRTRLQRAAGRGLTRFVGRQHEMDALTRAADLAKTGRGQIVAAMAEAGVGKSRLFHEFKLISQSDWMALEAFSVSYGKASAYLPVLELLRDYFRISADDDARTRREKVTGRILTLDRALEDTLPYLFALLGLSEGDDALAEMDAQVRRRRMHEAIKRILLRESMNQPLMVLFEDLHWIDGETQALLNVLADSIGTARLLLLVNYRPEYQHQWGSRTHYTQLRLDPLGRDNAQEMLNSVLGDEPGLAALKRLIIERTEGNPFFMEEMVQVLFDEGALMRNGGVKLTRPLGGLKIPPTVQAVLAARIDRLPSPHKELLQTLAVIGKDLASELIRAVTGRTEEEIEPMLADLQQGEFIYEQPSSAGAEYTFKHALTQEVAYNSVLAERRRAIHEQTARAVETLYAPRLEEHHSALAHHYLRSSDAAKAVHYARLAADQAVGRGAYPEAANMVEAALKLLDQLPEGAERLRAELALRGIERLLAFALGGPGSPEFERVVRRMSELGEKIGEADQVFNGLIALASLYFTRGEPAQSFELSTRCLELAEATQDPGLLADARLMRGISALFCGKLREAVSNLQDGMRVSELTNRSISRNGAVYRISFPCHLALALRLMGRISEAAKQAEQGLSYAREFKDPSGLGFALIIGGYIDHYRREPQMLRGHTQEAIALSEEYGLVNWLVLARVLHGCALAELGDLEQGVAEMEAGIAGIRRQGGLPSQQFATMLLAQGYARIGRTEEALRTLKEVLARIEPTGAKNDQAEMLRLKGEVLLMREVGAAAEAETCFRSAIEIARAQEARWWELRATTTLAKLLRDTGRRAEARAILAEIYNWFTDGFDTPDMKDAKALLDELGA
jgi:class 3 adenylate cyclase/tetratricopeptide (TPR) repeat protein